MRNRQHLREEVVGFLNTVARPGCRVDGMDDDTSLIDAGIVDSFAVVQIISYLEQNYGLDMQALAVDPGDLGSINGILAAIARSGE
jgi:acyl carrier protein